MLFRGRRLVQLLFLAMAAFLIIHGWWGPQFAPKNLTSLFIWVHYRGLLVITLLLAGNFFCMTCPMILVRDFFRRFVKPPLSWPSTWQNKYPSILLFIAVLFFYEFLDLWATPKGTSLLIVIIFILAFGTDILFKKATFCKYLCPVGQFNFLGSALSPLEIKKKESTTCEQCTTHDCLHGNKLKSNEGSYGCELDLFIPNKIGNMDCTFCMECVAACPHDNIKLGKQIPGGELFEDESRSGLGKLSRRKDFSALVVVFTFGALLNAFGMVGPAYMIQEKIANFFQWPSEMFTLGVLFVLFLIVLPWPLLEATNIMTKKLWPANRGQRPSIGTFIPSLIPIGFAFWFSHYLFHFLTGVLTFLPLMGISLPPRLMGVPVSIVMPIQLSIIVIGLLFSLWTCRQISLNLTGKETSSKTLPLVSILPWSLLHTGLALFGLWIMTLPMEMRGTFIGN